jgi:hypothetical protein
MRHGDPVTNETNVVDWRFHLQCLARAGKKKFMKRFPFFFFTAFLAVCAMIAIALLPLVPKSHVAIEARADGSALVFDAKALAAIVGAKDFPVTQAPGPRGDQTGPRLASFSPLEPNAPHSRGARLFFGPKTRAVLGQGPLTMRISAKPFANNPANAVAVGIVREGPVTWVQATLSPTSPIMEFNFPAGGTTPKGIAIWSSVGGQGKGFELQSIAFFRSHSETSQ